MADVYVPEREQALHELGAVEGGSVSGRRSAALQHCSKHCYSMRSEQDASIKLDCDADILRAALSMFVAQQRVRSVGNLVPRI